MRAMRLPVCWGGPLALVFLVLQLWPGASGSLRFVRPDFTHGAVWLPISAQWVHLTWPHAAVNAMSALLLCWALRGWVPMRCQLLALSGGMVGVALQLVADARCDYYAGASGALHGVAGGAALYMLAAPGRIRLAGGALGLALVAKLGWQDAAFVASPHWLDIPIYYPAHKAGALGGAAVVLVWLLARRWCPALHPSAQQGQAGQSH